MKKQEGMEVRTMDPITLGTNTLDSRDIIARIAELESLRLAALKLAHEAHEGLVAVQPGSDIPEDLTDAVDSLWTAEDGTEYGEVDGWYEDAHAELQALKSLAEDGEGVADWAHGARLILDSYFETYARNLAEDTGAIDRYARWPNNHIDWEAAAEELANDYATLVCGEYIYYVRK